MTVNEQAILRHITTRGLSIIVRDGVTSTNRLLKTLAEEGAPEGTVLIAASQSEGRGRLGRSFYSPDGTGLYMSILLRPTVPASESLSVTAAAAVAVCRAIEAVSSRVARIKWVNDVFCDDKKVCGILTEAALDPTTGGLSYAVLGIGVNVCDPKEGFPAEIAQTAASVYGNGEGDVNRLAAAILDAFFEQYGELEQKRFVREYRERSLLGGRRVTVKKADGDREATAVEVDEQCRLRVRYDDASEERLSSGDVSIRL